MWPLVMWFQPEMFSVVQGHPSQLLVSVFRFINHMQSYKMKSTQKTVLLLNLYVSWLVNALYE